MRRLAKINLFVFVTAILLSILPPQTLLAAKTSNIIANPTSSSVIVDGARTPFEAYNINGSNYFKLRDIAMAVNGSTSQFEVTWDSAKNAINLLTMEAYTPAGGELTVATKATIQTAQPTTSDIYVNGHIVHLGAYNINGSNYFKLRDIGEAIGFNVGWDATANSISLSTTSTSTATTSTTTETEIAKKITFADIALEDVIRGMIDKPTGDILSTDVSKITRITVSDVKHNSRSRIQKLSGIEALHNLLSLELFNNLIVDLQPLSGLSKLTSLNLAYNRIEDISPLKGLKLESLQIENNFIKDIQPLSNMVTLEYLSASNNYIKDISSMGKLIHLSSLHVENNIITDIDVFHSLEALKNVSLDGNPITDISPAGDKDHLGLYSYDQIETVGKLAHQITRDIIRPEMTDLAKEIAVHDYILNNVSYDHKFFNYNIPTKTDPGGTYGALVENIVVCEGYARTMTLLGQLAGLDILYMSGTTSGGVGHAWNLIKLDGSYYHVDATWNDGEQFENPQFEIERRLLEHQRRGYFNTTQSDRVQNLSWDIQRYPQAKLKSMNSQDYQIKVKINTEIPVERDLLYWLNIDMRYTENGTDYITDITSPFIYPANAVNWEVTMHIPSEIPLSKGIVTYGLGGQLFNISGIKADDSIFVGISSDMEIYKDWGASTSGTLLPDSTLYTVILKKEGIDVTYQQVEEQTKKRANEALYTMDGSMFAMVLKQVLSFPGAKDMNEYALINPTSFSLPPNSAVYVTSTLDRTPPRDSYFGELVVANHTNQSKSIRARDIELSLSMLYRDAWGTVTTPDGITTVMSSTGPYVRLVVYDGDFDESKPYGEYINENKTLVATDWVIVKHE